MSDEGQGESVFWIDAAIKAMVPLQNVLKYASDQMAC